jgi:hypothetical protein
MCPKCGGKTNGKRCLHCGPLPRAQTTKQPIGLSDRALAVVQRHAAALPVSQRDTFLRDVVDRLADAPSDDAVAVAVNIVLDRRAGAGWR